MKVKRDIFIQLVLICLYLFQLLFFRIDDSIHQLQVNIVQYELFVFYIYALVYAYLNKGAFSLYSLFLYAMFIFIYSRIFLDILGLFDWYWANKWMDFYFPLSTRYEILNLLLISLLCIHLGFLIGKGKKYIIKDCINHNEKLEKISLFFFYFSIPGTFTKYLIELKTILSYGYLAVFDGTLSRISYPVWTAGSGTLLICSYATFLASRPNKRKFWVITIIFFFLCAFNMMKGSRSKLFVPLMFLLWYYYEFYAKKHIAFCKLLLVGICCIVGSQLMLMSRDIGLQVEMSSIWSLFFIQQGVSLLVLGYMVYFKHTFINHGIPYIFAPLLFWETGYGQTSETINLTHRLAYKLTYFISPEAYIAGEGLGSSFLGEFYDLGYIAFIIMNCILGYIIYVTSVYAKINRLFLALSFVIVQTIIYMPRNTFLPLVEEFLPIVLFYYLAMYIAGKNVKFVYGRSSK